MVVCVDSVEGLEGIVNSGRMLKCVETYLQHDHGVSTDDHHADSFLVAAWFLFGGIVQDHVQVHIVATKDTNDFSASIKLDKDAFVEILYENLARAHRYAIENRKCNRNLDRRNRTNVS